MEQRVTAYIGIGSNVGDRRQFCRRAVEELQALDDTTVTAASSLYETSPIGPPQRSYVNAVVAIETTLTARGVFNACKAIEATIGRKPSDVRWGPRVIDLDVLLFGDEKIVEPDLEIPHPQIAERRFVLVPLLEIAPDASDPWGTPFREFLDEAEGDVTWLEPFDLQAD